MAEHRRISFKKALEFVLDHQFVQLSADDLYIFKVLVGSGMGLEMSGDVSDIAFHEMVEAEFVLNESVREKYHVEFYGRFRDDILLIIAGTPESRREFIDCLKVRSKFFKLKVESISRNSAVMLDLVVSKGFRFENIGSPDISIHTKSTAQGAALSSLSRHVPTVHSSWPMSRLLHYSNVVSHKSHFTEAALKLFSKVLASDCRHPSLGLIASSISHGTVVASGQRRKQNKSCSRLVIPWHPSLKSLPHRLHALRRSFEKADLAEVAPLIAWKLPDKSIFRLCLHDSKIKLA